MAEDELKQQEEADDQLINGAFEVLLKDYVSSRHRKKVDLITKAFNFARQAHKGVRRLSGEPYIMHPIAVAQIACKEIGLGSTSICAALLHDVVEDTDFTFDELLRRGVDKRIVETLRLLTHDKNTMTYEEYVQNIAISGNTIAIHVKYNDLCHNLKRGRAGGHMKQVAKHEKALAIIEPHIKER